MVFNDPLPTSLISQVLTPGGNATIKGRPSEVREQQHFPSPLCGGKRHARVPCTTKPASSSGLLRWARGGLIPANCRSSISSIRSSITKAALPEHPSRTVGSACRPRALPHCPVSWGLQLLRAASLPEGRWDSYHLYSILGWSRSL